MQIQKLVKSKVPSRVPKKPASWSEKCGDKGVVERHSLAANGLDRKFRDPAETAHELMHKGAVR